MLFKELLSSNGENKESGPMGEVGDFSVFKFFLAEDSSFLITGPFTKETHATS